PRAARYADVFAAAGARRPGRARDAQSDARKGAGRHRARVAAALEQRAAVDANGLRSRRREPDGPAPGSPHPHRIATDLAGRALRAVRHPQRARARARSEPARRRKETMTSLDPESSLTTSPSQAASPA